MMRADDYVGDDLRLLRIGHTWLEHANDRRCPVADAAQADLFPDDAAIAIESVVPETIGEHHHAGGVRTIVLRADQASQHGMQTHHVEKRSADDAALNGARFTQTHHGETHRGKVAECTHAFDAGFQVLDLRHGKRGVVGVDSGSTLADIDQPGFVTVDQWLEKNATHQREDRGVGADAQRQGEYHGNGHAGSPKQRMNCNSQIANERHVR